MLVLQEKRDNMNTINLEEAIAETKRMLEDRRYGVKVFNKYGHFYFHTNENVQMTLERLEFDKKRALSVMASGDQIFNLTYLGVREIDAFDVNVLTYFIFHLRRAIFLAYGYENSSAIEQCFSSVSADPKKLLEILITLRPFMNDEVYNFFEEVLNYNYYLYIINSNFDGNNFAALCICSRGKKLNLYNRSKKGFQRLQDNIENFSVNFKNEDIENMPSYLEGEYGLMHFSNIAEYYIRNKGEQSFVHLMNKFSYNLDSYGVIINYFFNYFIAEKLEYNFDYLRKIGFNGTMRVRSKNYESAVIIRKR